MYQWCGFKSRRGKNKNLTALKSNSNTVWFNFQTYIYIYIYITKDRVTRTPIKTGRKLRVSSYCSNSDIRRVNIVIHEVISHERGKDREVATTSGTYPWSFVTQIFHTGQPGHCGDRKAWFNSFLVGSNPILRKS